MERRNADSLHCKSIFKGDSTRQRRADLTLKLAELINAQERAKQISTASG